MKTLKPKRFLGQVHQEPVLFWQDSKNLHMDSPRYRSFVVVDPPYPPTTTFKPSLKVSCSRSLWVFAETSHKNLVEYQKLIKIKPKAGTKFVYDKKDANVKMVAVDLRGAQNASVDVAERHVMSPQRFIKRIVDREIFTPTYETGQI